MKEEYENASKKRDYHFEEEVLEFLRSFVRDNERKIESARKRLDLVEDNPEMEAKVCIYLNPSSVYISKGRVSSSLVPRHPIFRARPAALSKNRVWTRSLVKLGLNHTSVLACCHTNQIAQVK